MLQSLIKILSVSSVQIDTKMAEKYANQQYAVPLLHYDDLFQIYGLLRVAGVDRLALSIDRLYSCKMLLRRSLKSANNFFSVTKF